MLLAGHEKQNKLDQSPSAVGSDKAGLNSTLIT